MTGGFVLYLYDELRRDFPSVEPMDFYRAIFPLGELEEQGVYEDGKYCGIALEITKHKKKNGAPLVKRYSVTDGLDEIDGLLWVNDSFCLMAPISYAGKTRHSSNARYMYALCVEIDNLKENGKVQEGYKNLMHQIDKELLPRPTYIVASGTGLHLYYLWDFPLPLFPNVVKELQKYKRRLTTELWNRYITTSYRKEDVQQESIFQAFRMPGTITKSGGRVEVFETGERVSIEYMNQFVPERFRMEEKLDYKSKISLKKAQELYPEWYEKRIVQGKAKGHWTCNKGLYNWWKERIESEIKVGHRYYALMLLCIYGIKCDIDEEELRDDCYKLMEVFEELTPAGSDNQFTEKDVEDAFQAFYDKGYVTYPINSISKLSGLEIEKNKRNGRKRAEHVKLMNFVREEINGNKDWRNKDGRPDKRREVALFRRENPNGSKADCIRATGLDKKTVYKWWDEVAPAPIDYSEIYDL